MLVRWNVRKI